MDEDRGVRRFQCDGCGRGFNPAHADARTCYTIHPGRGSRSCGKKFCSQRCYEDHLKDEDSKR